MFRMLKEAIIQLILFQTQLLTQ